MAVAVLAAGMAAMGLGLVTGVLPAFDAVKSARPLAEIYRAESSPEEPYAVYPRLDAPVLFYTGRFAVWPGSEGELQAFVRRPGRVWLFIERDDLARLAEPLPLVEVARDNDPRDGYILMATPQL